MTDGMDSRLCGNGVGELLLVADVAGLRGNDVASLRGNGVASLRGNDVAGVVAGVCDIPSGKSGFDPAAFYRWKVEADLGPILSWEKSSSNSW